MRKGHISLLLCDFAYITTYLYFEEEPSGIVRKGSILRGFRRSAEVQGSPGHQEQDNTRRTGKARAAVHPGKNHTGRPENWHGQAVPGSTTVLGGTAVRQWWSAAG